MRINPLPVYQKQPKRKRGNKPTIAQRERWQRLKDFGCSVHGCKNRLLETHHCETKMGARKDHDKVITLCFNHHRGPQGIGTLSRRVWEDIYGSEQEHMRRAEALVPIQA